MAVAFIMHIYDVHSFDEDKPRVNIFTSKILL